LKERGEGRETEKIEVRKGEGKVLAQAALIPQTHPDQVVQDETVTAVRDLLDLEEDFHMKKS
jgi:hypothetical protein